MAELPRGTVTLVFSEQILLSATPLYSRLGS